ncbi:MAG: Uma2 family endonuclease [Pirellulaceae bacterium]
MIIAHQSTAGQTSWTATQVVDRFGPLPLARLRMSPLPGNAVEQDAVEILAGEQRLFELHDGMLLEKTMGAFESYIAGVLIWALNDFIRRDRLGIVYGPDGLFRIAPDEIRIPDVSFVSWQRLPNGEVPRDAISSIVPDLVAEIISHGNTPREMENKRREYLAAGVRLIWYVYPNARQVHVFHASPSDASSPDAETASPVVLSENDQLTGGEVLPGFSLPLGELFNPPAPPK